MLIHRGSLTATIALLLASVSLATPCRAAEPGTATAKPVPLRPDAADRYQNFIVNWDPSAPVLCAVVRTPADHAALFHPAPVIGARKPFAPPDATFSKEALVVVARVVPGGGASTLTIDRVTEQAGEILVHCRFRPATAPSSFTVKQAALAWIPLTTATRATFVENDAPVATLDLAAGTWVVPALADEAR